MCHIWSYNCAWIIDYVIMISTIIIAAIATPLQLYYYSPAQILHIKVALIRTLITKSLITSISTCFK